MCGSLSGKHIRWWSLVSRILHAHVACKGADHTEALPALVGRRSLRRPSHCAFCAHVCFVALGSKARIVAQVHLLNSQLETRCTPKGQIIIDKSHQHGDTSGHARANSCRILKFTLAYRVVVSSER